MTTLITVTNQKGGVGKTTTVVHLAHGLALLGKHVLIVDLDPQGQAALALDVEPAPGVFQLLVAEITPISLAGKTKYENLDIIPGNKKTGVAQTTIDVSMGDYPIEHIANVLKPAFKQYDYIIFDTSPSVGGLQERAIWASDGVLIPTATEFLSLKGMGETIATLKNLSARGWKGKILGILPTLYDSKTRESQKALQYLETHYKTLLLPPVHRATILRECVADGMTIFERDPESKSAQEYNEVVKRIRRL